MAALTKHRVTVGGTTAGGGRIYHFLARKQTFLGLASETGVDEAPLADRDEPVFKLSNLLLKGILVRVNAYYTESGKKRVAKLLVRTDLLKAALGDLPGKSVNGGVIQSCNVPTRSSVF
ncbi:hypothetical protein Cri9333_1742 [Crinalium epipsammum PCC 9333]|uniref:Uncharacterized protein n=1 Tax=Crinalium epipsammum PCC 9333 TaxID=1173022 RepID=K9VYQ4_9CYAN|nr:hypothetical protein [Crinalium epipsammum]AFZ12627.1 hypothetical protein Cri9333_1742 [Crinalium epipsammum PCC 9333]